MKQRVISVAAVWRAHGYLVSKSYMLAYLLKDDPAIDLPELDAKMCVSSSTGNSLIRDSFNRKFMSNKYELVRLFSIRLWWHFLKFEFAKVANDCLLGFANSCPNSHFATMRTASGIPALRFEAKYRCPDDNWSRFRPRFTKFSPNMRLV